MCIQAGQVGGGKGAIHSGSGRFYGPGFSTDPLFFCVNVLGNFIESRTNLEELFQG